MISLRSRAGIAVFVAASGVVAGLAAVDDRPGAPPHSWRQHDLRRPKPPVVEPAEAPIASRPPKDAVVLFDGTGLDAWASPGGGPARWKVVDGALETVPGAGMIETKRRFGDLQLPVEWASPSPPHGVGQDRGNSGVFLMGRYEIQVLDSYRAETYADGQAGAIYGQYPPLANASRPPGQWQSYDIAFRRPRFDDEGHRLEAAQITVFHNGILVQDNEEPFGQTSWLEWEPDQGRRGEEGPIALQDHDHPVRYRNIWVRELPDRPAPKIADLVRMPVLSLPAGVLDRYAGRYRSSNRAGSPAAVVAREGDHLTLRLPNRPRALRLDPISETKFDLPHTDGRFTFRVDASGRVTGVHFRIADSEREWERIGP